MTVPEPGCLMTVTYLNRQTWKNWLLHRAMLFSLVFLLTGCVAILSRPTLESLFAAALAQLHIKGVSTIAFGQDLSTEAKTAISHLELDHLGLKTTDRQHWPDNFGVPDGSTLVVEALSVEGTTGIASLLQGADGISGPACGNQTTVSASWTRTEGWAFSQPIWVTC